MSYQAINATKHGMYGTPIYRTWLRMIQRCHNPNNRNYDGYGGRGIKVCDRWRKFENFFEDMGDAPKGLTLERIDNNMGYSPDNCMWATRKEQARNRRTTRFYTLNGETLTVSEWAKKIGISHESMRKRINKWPLEKALTERKYDDKI